MFSDIILDMNALFDFTRGCSIVPLIYIFAYVTFESGDANAILVPMSLVVNAFRNILFNNLAYDNIRICNLKLNRE